MYSTRILLDSRAPSGARLTTWELTYPRFVHAELMTHRTFCLAGDVELEFDLPAGNIHGGRRVYAMRLDEFVDKWHHGARRVGAKPKLPLDLTWIDDEAEYDAPTVAARLGLAGATNIHSACRAGTLPGRKGDRTWFIRGADVRAWRQAVPAENRYDMRARLQAMQIRQLNEQTGDIQTSYVTDAVFSGVKPVYEVRAGAFSVAGSTDHRVLTDSGWKTLGELTSDDHLVVRRFGKPEDERLDPLRLKKIDGKWRAPWQLAQRQALVAEDPQCRRCGTRPGVEVHHVVPVYRDPSRAFDATNITLLCGPCHAEQHETQDWQGGTYLYGALVKVDEVVYRGDEPTYDLSIAGADPNFLANGVVVHNSRNAASSRAIPIEKMIASVKHDPALPQWWGKNQAGMQARQALQGDALSEVQRLWLEARDEAIVKVEHMSALGLHKQLANRLLEPWMFITVLVSATTFSNWFHLRDHPDAQPEIAWVARSMWPQYQASVPTELPAGAWHLPFITADERMANALEDLKKISTGRCARVSYLTHEGTRDLAKDVELHDRLCRGPQTGDPGHWSPFEHVAQALETLEPSGNFRGWRQYRKEFPAEHYGGVMP